MTGRQSIRMTLMLMAWFLVLLLVPAILPLNFPSLRISSVIIRTDYLVHVLIFTSLVLTLLWVRVNITNPLIFFTLVAIGVLSEYVQIYIPNRTYNIYDLISNLLGVVLGYALLAFVRFVGATRKLH